MKKNVLGTKDCFGCGLCAAVCPKNVLRLIVNLDGFYEPSVINQDACIHCGLCYDVCSFNNKGLAQESTSVKAYAGWSKDAAIRKQCTSGGIAFEIGRHLLLQGYGICGARYVESSRRVEHFIAKNESELRKTIGSKYMQSYMLDSLKNINRREKYMIVGTPCQIDSIRRYAKIFHCEKNFVLIDFFCHGVPSIHLWNKYCVENEKKIGHIKEVSWRAKADGWHDSYVMNLTGASGKISSKLSDGDMYLKFFLRDACLGKQCYKNCKFKYNCSSADLRIGDFWGKLYKENEDGVNSIVAFTNAGELLLEELPNVELVRLSFEDSADGQMRENAKKPWFRGLILFLIKSFLPMKAAYYVMQALRWRSIICAKIKI